MNPELVDQLYESAFIPERWPATLSDLANIATARTGWLALVADDVNICAASSERTLGLLQPMVASGAIVRSERWLRAHRLNHAGFIVERDIFTDEELKRDPFYRDFLYPIGVGHGAATIFRLPTGDDMLLSLEREFVRGPLENEAIKRLDALRPHLARAALISARLRLERSRVVSETLAALGLPALVIDDKGKVLAANHLIEELTGFVHWRARDRASLKDRAADQLLRNAITTINLTNASCVRSFPVRDAEADVMMVAHVVPVRLAARDIFARSIAVLVLTLVTLPQAPPVELVQSLFDLTPAEARVARSLASGKTVDDIASAGGVAPSTVRTHVRGVLEKTGCRRQAEVVALLTGISSARLSDSV
jgi:DNA-binding CsgD family transcriptional regulator